MSRTIARETEKSLRALNQIGIALSQERDVQKLLELILTESRQFTGAEAGSLYVREGDQLRFAVTQNEVLEKRRRAQARKRRSTEEAAEPSKPAAAEPKAGFSGFYVSLDKTSLAGFVGVTGKILNIPDAYRIPSSREYRFNRSFDEKNDYRTRSMLIVPMRDTGGRVIGVLQLINARRKGKVVPFPKEVESLVLSLASQAAVALTNARMTEELHEAYLDSIHRLSIAAEFKDDDTAMHIQRMSRYSALVAEGLGLSKDEVRQIGFAAPMHDIGKIGIPDAILLKPGKLTPDEFKVMQKHTVYGAKILEGAKSDVLRMSESIALHHHEKWDGSGYPRGVRGTAIPLPSRIVALADVFDALTQKRCYKPAFPVDQSLAIIKQGSGRHFDPKVVQSFLDNLDRVLAVMAQYKD